MHYKQKCTHFSPVSDNRASLLRSSAPPKRTPSESQRDSLSRLWKNQVIMAMRLVPPIPSIAVRCASPDLSLRYVCQILYNISIARHSHIMTYNSVFIFSSSIKTRALFIWHFHVCFIYLLLFSFKSTFKIRRNLSQYDYDHTDSKMLHLRLFFYYFLMF